MDGLVTAFKEGGAPMFGVLGLDGCLCTALAVGVVLAAVGTRSARAASVARAAGAVLLVGAFVPLCAGGLGYWLGMQNVESAVTLVEPHQRAEIYSIGQAESMNNLYFGGGSAVCFALSAFVLLGLTGSLSPRADE